MVEIYWVVLNFYMKNLQFLIIIPVLFQCCGSESQGPDQYGEPSMPEEIITFEKYVEMLRHQLSRQLTVAILWQVGKMVKHG